MKSTEEATAKTSHYIALIDRYLGLSPLLGPGEVEINGVNYRFDFKAWRDAIFIKLFTEVDNSEIEKYRQLDSNENEFIYIFDCGKHRIAKRRFDYDLDEFRTFTKEIAHQAEKIGGVLLDEETMWTRDPVTKKWSKKKPFFLQQAIDVLHGL